MLWGRQQAAGVGEHALVQHRVPLLLHAPVPQHARPQRQGGTATGVQSDWGVVLWSRPRTSSAVATLEGY